MEKPSKFGSMFAWNEPLGRLIRTPLRLLPKDTILPILSGPNRGLRWTVGSGNHGCWLGSYERRNAVLLRSLCHPGTVVFDVGANSGYFTLLFARGTGKEGSVLAFEPDPSNIAHLERNLSLNLVANVSVVSAAVTDREGEAKFECAASMGHVSHEGPFTVKTCCLDDFPTPNLIKMDIEGSETLALQGADKILRNRATTWFIELHGNTAKPCTEMFLSHGYIVERVGAGHILARPTTR